MSWPLVYTALVRLPAENGFDPLVEKRHLSMVAAHKLSTIMQSSIGVVGPRSMQALLVLLQTACIHFQWLDLGDEPHRAGQHRFTEAERQHPIPLSSGCVEDHGFSGGPTPTTMGKLLPCIHF